MEKNRAVHYIYNPSNQSEEELINNFVIRKKEYKRIISDIEDSTMEYPEQNYIIQGQRGYGKTTLLNRLFLEVKNSEKLNAWLIPIIFPEEQYNIRKLYSLWESIAEELDEIEGFYGIYDGITENEEIEEYEHRSFNILIEYLRKNKKKILLFIDNIGDVLNKFSEKEHQRLREVLMTCPDIRIVGASSEILEHTSDYSKPFYQFFKVIELKGLSSEETKQLLSTLGDQTQGIDEKIDRNSARIEALRRLTGGVPRTIVLLFDIFMDEEGDSFKDLELILDRVTPLYKHRMDNLSHIEQEIVNTIALNWDAMATKDIAQKMRMPSKNISAQLNKLEKNRVVEKIAENKKNYSYQIKERFFNIWYLMRFGRRKDRNKVKWLVYFLESWCSRDELRARTIKHIDNIKKGGLYPKYACYMTQALAKTSIGGPLEHELITTTREYLKKNSRELLGEVSDSQIELYEKLEYAIENRKLIESLRIIKEVKMDEGMRYAFMAALYRENGRFKEAEKMYEHAVESGNYAVLNDLGITYIYNGEEDKAEEALKQAREEGSLKALYNLGELYRRQGRMNEAEKIYIEAYKMGDLSAIFSLGVFYEDKGNIEEAKKWYKDASLIGNISAMVNLGLLYAQESDKKNAEYWYLKAIQNNDVDAMSNLGLLYYEAEDYEKAMKWYEQASEKGNREAMFNMALLYMKKNEKKEAKKWYIKAAEKGLGQSMMKLGELYIEEENKQDAKYWYEKAAENNVVEAMESLSTLYFKEGNEIASKEWLEKAIQNGSVKGIVIKGTIYEEEGKKEEAIDLYKRAYEKDKKEAGFYIGGWHEEDGNIKYAEKFYKESAELGNVQAMNNLGLLYMKQKKNRDAIQWYERAIESGDDLAIFGLGVVYIFENELDKADEIYQKLKTLELRNYMIEFAYTYINCNLIDKKEYVMEMVEYVADGSDDEKSQICLATVNLWNDNIGESLKLILNLLSSSKELDCIDELTTYFKILMAKGQYNSAFKLFSENNTELKDRFRPIYYALIYFMGEEYEVEYRKMGSEIKETVEEIIEEIKQLEKIYR